MTAKILGTKKEPFSVNVLENNATKYIFRPYISFNISFYNITCHLSPFRCPKVLFGPFRQRHLVSMVYTVLII